MDYFFLAQTSGNAAGWFASLGLAGLLFAGALVLFWLWMLVDALTSNSLNGREKIVWAAVIFFFPFFGALIYMFVGRRPRAGGG